MVVNFSMDTWVTFKLFGQMGINFFYIIVMVVYLVASGALSEEQLNEGQDPDKNGDEDDSAIANSSDGSNK